MKINVVHKDELLPLVERKGLRDYVFPKLLDRLESCRDVIENLQIKIPVNYKPWPTRNNIVMGYLHIENLAGILCLYILDPFEVEKPLGHNKFNYSLEELQKIFIHLDKQKLKSIDIQFGYREGYNELLKTLTKNNHPFGLISLDENWNIVGNQCKDFDSIESYIIDLDDSKKEINPLESDYKKFDKDGNIISEKDKRLQKKWNKTRWFFSLLFIIGFVALLFGIHYWMRDKYVQDKIKTIEPAKFHKDPSNLGIGFLNFGNYKEGNELSMAYLQYRKTSEIKLYSTAVNSGSFDITSSRSGLEFEKAGVSSTTRFVSYLDGSSARITDSAYLIDLPSSWAIEILCVRVENREKVGGKICKGYPFINDFTPEQFATQGGVSLGTLDRVINTYNGKSYLCDVTQITYELLITNTSGLN